ncbi:hypothetical protein evm_014462 [Chilo suppressalis]|nr:hypothetical protein evm_014462 [Chilo suppressalis]
MDGIGRLGHDPPCGPSADWRVLTTADAAGTNGLTCLPKHEGTQDRKFLVTHPMTDHCEIRKPVVDGVFSDKNILKEKMVFLSPEFSVSVLNRATVLVLVERRAVSATRHPVSILRGDWHQSCHPSSSRKLSSPRMLLQASTIVFGLPIRELLCLATPLHRATVSEGEGSAGAEKALFRALKTRSNTPKYGLLYHSTFIGRAGLKNKGRISRYLANKCSIASRIDCFSESLTTIFGEKLRQQVEDRLKFYETGDIPKKNIEVMKEAMEEANQAAEEAAASAKKKKKKKKKKEQEAMDED